MEEDKRNARYVAKLLREIFGNVEEVYPRERKNERTFYINGVDVRVRVDFDNEKCWFRIRPGDEVRDMMESKGIDELSVYLDDLGTGYEFCGEIPLNVDSFVSLLALLEQLGKVI